MGEFGESGGEHHLPRLSGYQRRAEQKCGVDRFQHAREGELRRVFTVPRDEATGEAWTVEAFAAHSGMPVETVRRIVAPHPDDASDAGQEGRDGSS